MRKWVVIASTLLLLVVVNAGIASRERLVEHGRVVLLELAPVDPRSLMQGDYMALRFDLANHIQPDQSGSAGLIVAPNGIATYNPDQSAPGLRIRYRVRNQQVWLGTNAYFFEEGSAQRYQGARYGEFRVDWDSGEAVLVGLTGDDLKRK